MEYKRFGSVAVLTGNRKVHVTDEVEISCDGALRLRLDGGRTHESVGGIFKVPVTEFDGGSDVSFEFEDGIVFGTPLSLYLIDGERYIICGELTQRASIERLESVIGRLSELSDDLRSRVEALEGFGRRFEVLERRANSGDIIDF